MSKTPDNNSGSASRVRVRFAPSPTGDLHVGGVRTALFNWLYARHTGGKFLLRIEDTDRQRSTEAAIQVILDGMKWLGMEPDEDILYQSQGVSRHRDAALKILDDGKAYRCFCDPEQIAAQREEARAKGTPMSLMRCCAHLSDREIQMKLNTGQPYAIRLLVPDGTVTFTDGVHGEVSVAGTEIEDFVILRSDGTPTYMLAVVVDDLEMDVSHIIRGDDHLSNTPKQILLYQALGRTPPLFAHVPTILGPDKKKLSKRHGATSVTAYRDMGYLPETLVNYLGLLGWTPGDDREVMEVEELIRLFDIPGISRSSAVFDEAKLRWLNGHYISHREFTQVSGELTVLGRQAAASGALKSEPTAAEIETAWSLLKNRIHLLPELFEWGLYLFQDPSDYDAKGVKQLLEAAGAADNLDALAEVFHRLERFDEASVESAAREFAESRGVGAGKVIHLLRMAVSGVTGGPGLFELLTAVGRDAVVRRLRKATEWARGNAECKM